MSETTLTTAQRSPQELIAELSKAGVQLWEESGVLRFRAPKGVMTGERVAVLRAHKPAILDVLRSTGLPVVTADAANAHEPFPLTDVQTAYLMGRRHRYAYGGIACHMYVEVEYDDLDPVRLERAWNRLIARHDMLRAVIDEDGSQRVLPEVPPYRIAYTDLRMSEATSVERFLTTVRDELGHQQIDTSRWPLFELRLTRTPDGAVLHVSVDFLLADWASISMLLDQIELLERDPDYPLSETEISFRDYVVAERGIRDTAKYQQDRDYWLNRVDDLPPAPELPVSSHEDARPTFARRVLHLAPADWAAFKQRAGVAGVTASGAVLAAYAEVIGMWSRRTDFTLNLTLLNRLPLHADVPALIGDFTSVTLLEVRPGAAVTFAERAQRLGTQLFDDLDHRLFSGIEVIREVARRRRQDEALMPVVFTGSIGLESGTAEPSRGRLGYGISQTPQVWIDCQALERDNALQLNWDVRTEVFPDGMVDDMFVAFEELLGRLAREDGAWQSAAPVTLPRAQARRRAEANATMGPIPNQLLHEPVLAAARRHADRVAVVDSAGGHTYRELAERAGAFAAALTGAGLAPGDIVAVELDKGFDQIAAVLGALVAGGAYLPLDRGNPQVRRDRILIDSGACFVLGARAAGEVPDSVVYLGADAVAAAAPIQPVTWREPDQLAYVIYTSGSTGTPKGVMVSHRAAANTVADICERFAVTAEDRVLGLANLGFDLSVYDIVGALGVGATLVLPDPARRGDPGHWVELVEHYGITVWNSVPAQLQMVSHYLSSNPGIELSSLRLALLSGDWIPVTLPDEIRSRIPGLRLISLGGATEAAIWSIHYPIEDVDPAATSIPYGFPLRNQTFHVYDQELRDRPDWVPGELYIGGIGVALGYRNDPERTEQRFPRHPVTGATLYRTGDYGRYLPSGAIEFLGREDDQIKIRGHRIELAEVEAAVLSHPAVSGAVVLVDGTETVRRRLVAFVAVTEPVDELGLAGYLRDLLPGYMCPSEIHSLEAIPVTANGKVDRAALATRLRGQATVEPVGDDQPKAGLEATLAQLWTEVLGVERVGRTDDFFALGGNSLLSTQLVATMRDRVPEAAGMYFDTLVRELLPEPTVAAMARYLASTAETVVAEQASRKIVSPLVVLGKGVEEPVVVLVHDGTGKFYNFAELPTLLDPNRKAVGLTAGDADTYLRTGADQLIERRAAAYARLIRAEGTERVQVAGYGSTALLALELALELTTAGTAVERVVLVDPYRITDTVRDDAELEYLFAKEIGVDPESVGYPSTLAQVAGHRWTSTSAERLAAIGASVRIATDITTARRYDIFCATVEALREHRVEPYAGEVVVIGSAPEPQLAGLVDELSGLLGDLVVQPSDGATMKVLAALLNGTRV
ncbi:non-ribosomal peptide synthetase [Nocardia sp. CNY236]|uniref:non-ribosomal peptide synthetase n=1 Tax=Nocardia sp. CNY236 TaxID=1169152 RepID=UPI00040CF6DC|nr:non-ribosomal peptide synthetase [Nocardia sp. CNY236]